ncbi:MAG: DUF2877 domain-containing protein [Acidobacteria bacterium]|nr:DUF2877 domain-containing protein [Acidobacteriota bacterium]
MKLLRVGDGVGRGRWAFHSRFRRCLNFFDGETLVTVALPELGAGPHRLVTDRLPETGEGPLTVDSGRVYFAGRCHVFSDAQIYRSRPDWGCPDPGLLSAGLGSLQRVLTDRAPAGSLVWLMGGRPPDDAGSAFDRELFRRLGEGAALLLGADPPAGARLLRGVGRGLTPSGDDLLAGALHGWRLAQAWDGVSRESRIRAVYDESRGDNPFSATFLREARDGRVFEHLEGLVRALMSGSAGAVEAAAERLLGVGDTSGADLATGLWLALARNVS